MSIALDDRVRRQARARALAASIIDTPQIARRFVITDPRTLIPSARRRLHRRAPAAPAVPRSRKWTRRHTAAAVLLAQVGALVALLAAPVFKVHRIEISGSRLLSTDALTRVAGIGGGQSIFTVDGDAVRKRLIADPWISSVSVETSLPATVRVSITEHDPVMRVRRTGGDLLVAAGGATLAVADARAHAIPSGLPLLEDRRPVPDGESPPPLDTALLRVLADTAARFPDVYGVKLTSFTWQPDGVLTILAATGFHAVLGHVDEPTQIDLIPGQLAALAALRGHVNFEHPDFGYVDLENLSAPAVGGHPGQAEPAVVTVANAAPAKPATDQPAASPAPAASPTPAPATSPAAGPTPIVVPNH